VAVAYLVLAALGAYLTARSLYGRWVGLATVLAFAAFTQIGAFAHGRSVIGEPAAIAFLLWGAVALIRARQTADTRLYLATGLFLGLAILSKSQFIVLVPTLLAVWLLGRGSTASVSLKQLCLMLVALAIPLGLWYSAWLFTFGIDGLIDRLRSLSEIARYSSYVPPFSATARGLNALAGGQFLAWGLPAVFYVGVLALRDGSHREPERLFLPTFVLIWLIWFLIESIGYARYAAPAALVSTIFVAKLAIDLVRHFFPSDISKQSFRDVAASPLGVAVLALLTLTAFTGIAQNALAAGRANDDSPQRFATAVAQYVEPGEVIESAEWELKFLSDRSFTHPPVPLINDAVAVVFLGKPAQSLLAYEPSGLASYVVEGPFSKVSGLYRGSLSRGELEPLFSYGEYDLYRRR
jgi:4-amino-4-deoxy-L-arabinose transferase-like glycosyltransferase